DDILSGELEHLVALCSEALALGRVEPNLDFLDARPLRYGDTLRRIAEYSGDLVADDEIATGLLEHLLNMCVVSPNPSLIEDLGLGDEVHLLGLSVEALDRCDTESSTRDHRQRNCVPSFHDDIPPNRPAPNSSVRGRNHATLS